MVYDNARLDIESRAEAMKQAMTQLPFVTDELPGIGGVIKAEPDHFQVEEQLPYTPCGEGGHVYVTLKRAGWNTAMVGETLAGAFKLRPQDVGWGGRKDKQAVCTQTFSLCMAPTEPLDDIRSRLQALPFDILDVQRHRNKIKTGHVAANRFRILLSNPSTADALVIARVIGDMIRQRSIPNYYGPQRFGIGLANIDQAVGLLQRPKAARGAKGAFLASVLQSVLFNQWLAKRMLRGDYDTILKGDLAQKTDTRGLFIVEDVEEAKERLARKAIVYTGPIFGYKMMNAQGEAAKREDEVLSDYGLSTLDFKPLRAPGTRRSARLDLSDLSIEPAEGGILFSFTLPSGAFATTVLREFMRRP